MAWRGQGWMRTFLTVAAKPSRQILQGFLHFLCLWKALSSWCLKWCSKPSATFVYKVLLLATCSKAQVRHTGFIYPKRLAQMALLKSRSNADMMSKFPKRSTHCRLAFLISRLSLWQRWEPVQTPARASISWLSFSIHKFLGKYSMQVCPNQTGTAGRQRLLVKMNLGSFWGI